MIDVSVLPAPPARAVALFVAAMLVLVGCGDDDDAAPEPTSTVTSTTTTSTTSTSAPTSTTAAGTACPEGASPAGEARGDGVSLDADGDGEPDELTVHVTEPATLELAVAYGAGGRTVVAYEDDSIATFADLRVAAVHDVDGDGDDDAWIVVGAGASVEVVTLVLADGCDLVRPDVDERPNVFAVGASLRHVSGVECVDGGFLAHEGESADGSSYQGTTTTWTVGADATLQRAGQEPFEITADSGDQLRYGSLTCG